MSLPRPQVPGQRRRLGLHALHHVAVAGEHVRAVVEHLVPGAVVARREVRLADRHADGVRDALPERPGRGLDAAVRWLSGWPGVRLCHCRKRLSCSSVMSGSRSGAAARTAAPTPWPADSTKRSRSMQRGSAGLWRRKRVAQHVGHRRRAQRHAGMARGRVLHHVDREEADRVDAQPDRARPGS